MNYRVVQKMAVCNDQLNDSDYDDDSEYDYDDNDFDEEDADWIFFVLSEYGELSIIVDSSDDEVNDDANNDVNDDVNNDVNDGVNIYRNHSRHNINIER